MLFLPFFKRTQSDPFLQAFEANTVRKATEVIDQLLMAKIEGFTEEEAQDLLQESERV